MFLCLIQGIVSLAFVDLKVPLGVVSEFIGTIDVEESQVGYMSWASQTHTAVSDFTLHLSYRKLTVLLNALFQFHVRDMYPCLIFTE